MPKLSMLEKYAISSRVFHRTTQSMLFMGRLDPRGLGQVELGQQFGIFDRSDRVRNVL